MEVLVVLLSGAAVMAAGIALLLTSQATVGVVLMAGACLLAILARLVQAAHHTRQITRLLERLLQTRQPAEPR